MRNERNPPKKTEIIIPLILRNPSHSNRRRSHHRDLTLHLLLHLYSRCQFWPSHFPKCRSQGNELCCSKNITSSSASLTLSIFLAGVANIMLLGSFDVEGDMAIDVLVYRVTSLVIRTAI
jgi:hypothetical protein